jgi:hypothetical protein
VWAACNKDGGTTDCTTATTCSAASQNCSPSDKYDGTVTSKGSRSVVTGVGYGESGKSSTKDGAACTYVCTITSDCAGKSPQVDVSGGKNVTPDGSTCTGS